MARGRGVLRGIVLRLLAVLVTVIVFFGVGYAIGKMLV
jgi:hypothetical protein